MGLYGFLNIFMYFNSVGDRVESILPILKIQNLRPEERKGSPSRSQCPPGRNMA